MDGDPIVGQVVADRFEVKRPIARGSMGAVYLAIQRPLGREVALKILAHERTIGGNIDQRFLKEASTLANLKHPNTVRVYDYGIWQHRPWIAMEYVDGYSLQTLVERGTPLDPLRTLHIVRQITAAVSEAHAVRVVHRDLKPGNVLLTEHGTETDVVKVVDFGLVKEVADKNEMTAQGVMLGTPKYMAPEQIDGGAVDGRTDLYAIGVILFRMLTGRLPFDSDRQVAVLMAHMRKPPPTFEEVAPQLRLPPCIEWTVRTCLAKDPDKRFADANQLMLALNACDLTLREPTLHDAEILLDEDGNTVVPQVLQRLTTSWGSVSGAPIRLSETTTGRPLLPRVLEPEPTVVEESGPSRAVIAAAVIALGLLGIGGVAAILAGQGPGRTVVSGEIAGGTTWTADTVWELDGLVTVVGGPLTVEPGTRVEGRPGSALLITTTARLDARGRADAPIVFSGVGASDAGRPGLWGGLVLLGSAPVEGGTQVAGISRNDRNGRFGGDLPESSCGVLEYVRVEYAGYEASQGDELNGLTLGGCGSGTIVRHLHVHASLDDGVELFGGSADLQDVLITEPGDDGLDWESGWTGRGQRIAIRMAPDRGDHAIEASGSPSGLGPVLYNLTLVAPNGSAAQRGLLLQTGAAGELQNLVIQGFGIEAIDVRDEATVAAIREGRLQLGHAVIHDVGPDGRTWTASELNRDDDGGFDENAWLEDRANGNLLGGDPDLTGLVPSEQGMAARLAHPPPEGEFWSEGDTWAGAVQPGTGKPFYAWSLPEAVE